MITGLIIDGKHKGEQVQNPFDRVIKKVYTPPQNLMNGEYIGEIPKTFGEETIYHKFECYIEDEEIYFWSENPNIDMKYVMNQLLNNFSRIEDLIKHIGNEENSR